MGTDMEQKPSRDIRIGDRVRLKSDGGRGFEWTVVGRSFGTLTFDLAYGDPDDPGRIMRSVLPALLERIDVAANQEA